MNKPVKVAPCPGCGSSIPLDQADLWVTHTVSGASSSYTCVGSGEAPKQENIETVLVAD